jgi:hypothetical protein
MLNYGYDCACVIFAHIACVYVTKSIGVRLVEAIESVLSHWLGRQVC